ncbi:hypothetical protein BJX99DRAFT_256662 [Aspergillus californicus]
MATTTTDDLPHDNLQAQAIGLIFGFPAAATIVVLLRVYIRVWTRTFAADDWVICFGAILYWAETITSYHVVKYNYVGYHVWDIPKNPPTVLGAKFAYATELLYNPILAIIKTSILLFLLRLTGQKVAVRRAIWGLLALNAVATVATFLITAFNCLPVASNWNPSAYPDKKCINFADFVTGTASVSIFTDVLVLLLPTWIVYNLRIARRQKVMLIGILSFGLITVISGIVRVILLDNFDRNIPADSTYSVLFCISTIEVGLAFVAACAPALKPLFVKILPKLFSTRSRSGGQYNQALGSGGRLGYGLNVLARSGRTQEGLNTNVTSVEAEAGEDDMGYAERGGRKDRIMMTTETEVKWDDQGRERVDEGSSMESLVQPRR